MKKLGYFYKERLQSELKEKLDTKSDFIVLTYLGVKAPEFSALRMQLRKAGARAVIVKNTLTKKTLKEKGLDSASAFIDGPTAFVLGFDDPISVSKALVSYAKGNKAITIKGGILDSRVLNPDDFKRISEIPSVEVLRGMLCMYLNSPIRGLVNVLHGNIRQFVYTLNQIAEKKKVT